jgi:hypothetical protein
MERVLHITLVRNDGLPDNKVLSVLDSIKAHGFHITKAGAFLDGGFSATCEWRCIAPNRTRASLPPVVSRNRAEALAALAIDLGQGESMEKDINGLWLTLARHDGKPDNKLGHLYGAGRMQGFDFFLPKYVGARRDVAYLEYTYRGALQITEALASLAASLGQANKHLDGTEIAF